MGILFILVGVLILVAFGLGTEGGAASRLGTNPAREDTFFTLPDIVVPSAATAYTISVVCMFLGGSSWRAGSGSANMVLGVVALLFVFTFLVRPAAGR